ncbi:aspartyl-tRNA(Asn) amidotransferase, B subunit [Halorhabdus utahensis DSM 12940]|uniref:Glutamyl-tRNA(Gln) amidotransferase subunit E n=1 Tax=Halorhabdus utahensis (strain DSM 12940 / JCM 11049 / AX-2) TaxID=519442 RepID=C7NQ93_HALUD|nr:Glu-tRNA(Gln) amidotransferase subunit GatE [Halorhabdus utahensis]ACV12819.1 aspartyl-tRNA(Asn) amidotransferase, B subunit [Halorhabdus utahensis DSM 12940]
MTEDFDYEALGLVAGLEIHQQLDTAAKLFCECPTTLREPDESTTTITRYLHPTKSELGELDEAALEESQVEREFEYLTYDSTCLVEADDEPPHRVDDEAMAVALEIAQLLDMRAVDQVHVMRKLVIDGSNTSGFQRTMMVATDGEIETSEGPVGVEDLMLEEESAQRVQETDSGVRYSLDRLGIPLVEIGTDPDIRSPAQAQEAAERIGMLLRSTGQVRRGLGTIRQDVNVSIAEGARVEIKGVQSLEDIEAIVRNEVGRQAELLDIAEELDDRDATVGDPQAVTEIFEGTDSGVIQGALTDGGDVWAVALPGFGGLVGQEIQPDRRLGTEFSDHAKRHGAGGIFHTDELPAYGVTEAEVEALAEAVDLDPDAVTGEESEDAVAIVADAPEIAEQSIEAVAERAETAMDGVPEETRDATEEATTRYLRPLPGAARMYPETDVPPVEPDPEEVETPELLTEKTERYQEDFDLDAGLAEQVAYGKRWELFEEAVESGVDATLAAQTVESTVTEIRRDGAPVEHLTDDHFQSVFGLLAEDELAKEGVPDLLAALAENPDLSAEEAAEQEGLGSAGEDEVREAVVTVVERNASQIEDEGMGAFSGLMGECMGELRGKADGDVVSDVLREEIQKRA